MFLVVAAAGVEPLPVGSGYVNQGDAQTPYSQTTQRFALIDVCPPAARKNDVNGFMKRRLRDADRDDGRRPQDRLESNRRLLRSLRYPAMFESPLVGGSAPGFYARNVDVFIDAVRSQQDVFSSAADCVDAQSEYDFF